jgi:hypothetical protein
MSNESMIVEVIYTVKDIRRPLIKSARNSMILTVIYVFVMLFIVYVVVSHFVTVELSESFRLSAVIFLIVAPLLTVVFNLVSYERLARKRAAAIGTITLQITETGVTQSEESKTATLEWAAYKRAIEFQDRFELVTNGRLGLLLPKRCFGSQERLESFRELLRKVFEGKIEQR